MMLLLRKFPKIFSVFYNVESNIIPLHLAAIVSNLLPEIAEIYPATTIALCKTLGLGILDLLELWASDLNGMRKRWKGKSHKEIRSITRNFFPLFIKNGFRNSHPAIFELLAFENALISCNDQSLLRLKFNYDVMKLRCIKYDNDATLSSFFKKPQTLYFRQTAEGVAILREKVSPEIEDRHVKLSFDRLSSLGRLCPIGIMGQ